LDSVIITKSPSHPVAKSPSRKKKAEMILGYTPEYDAREGFEKVAEWYYEALK
jgi:nucleoside-diphosphate-sugar epimerase